MSDPKFQPNYGRSNDLFPLDTPRQAEKPPGDKAHTINYLAAAISYLAQIGDELASLNDDGAPTETHNYFAVLRLVESAWMPCSGKYPTPADVLALFQHAQSRLLGESRFPYSLAS